MNEDIKELASKVPAATVAFWIVKVLATTVGEVGGNLISMDMGLGYLAATAMAARIAAIIMSLSPR